MSIKAAFCFSAARCRRLSFELQSRATLHNTRDQPIGRMPFALVALCFLLSGFAALLYETVWLRQFSIHFGTSEQALGIVLGTYMGGLALGSILASKFANRILRPLLTYGILELGIAGTALLVPVLLSFARYLQVAFFGGSDQPPDAGEASQVAFAFLGAITATILPTTMMGATLPMLAKYVVHRDEHIGKRIGGLYAINTFGAVLGTLCAAFVFLPKLGLFKTVLVGACINISIFMLIWWVFRTSGEQTFEASKNAESDPAPLPRDGVQKIDRGADWILLLIGCSGAVSFTFEILFTRMLGHMLGGSLFAFASMLASFLLGIALGGAIASRFSRNRAMSATGFFYAQCGTAILALVSFHALNWMAGTINDHVLGNSGQSIPRVIIAILILFPPALTIGMTFPWAIRIHAKSQADAAISSAKVYACSTIGGVAGAFLTGTYLLPMTNYPLSMLIAMSLNLAIAAAAFYCANLNRSHLAGLLVASAIGLLWLPPHPDQLLRVSSFENYMTPGALIYSKTGRSATVTSHRSAGTFILSSNGLPEAGVKSRGALFDWNKTTTWLGVLPTLLRPDTQSMLVVGFGGGLAPAHAPRSVREIDVFELEEGILEANQMISSVRERDPMLDPRLNIILNDGRSGLALTNKKYDAIVSQPSHPWTAGASHLYTLEFAQLARDHLNEEGVFVLWMDRQFLDVTILRSLAATLGDVFEHISLFQPNETAMLFVGSPQPLTLPIEPSVPTSPDDRELFQAMSVDLPFAVHAALGLGNDALRSLGADSSITTDNNNLLALRRIALSDYAENQRELDALINQHDRMLVNDTIDGMTLDRAFLSIRRAAIGRRENAKRMCASIKNDSERLFVEASLALADGDLDQTQQLLRQAIELDNDSQKAWVMLYLSAAIMKDSDLDLDRPGSHLREPYLSLVWGTKHLAANEQVHWEPIDQELARIPKHDPLFANATMLRIQWRYLKLGSNEDEKVDRVKYAKEILDMIQRVFPHYTKDQFLMPRLKAALFTNRPFIALSTAQATVTNIEERLRVVSQKENAKVQSDAKKTSQSRALDLRKLEVQLINCTRALESISQNQRVPRPWVEEVGNSIVIALEKVRARQETRRSP